jgi:hypothetical protein
MTHLRFRRCGVNRRWKWEEQQALGGLNVLPRAYSLFCRLAYGFLCVVCLTPLSFAQTYTQRGFLENRGTFYPQKALNDSGRAIGESLLRYEGFYLPSTQIQVAGAVDFRIDTHHQVDRDFHLSWLDRGVQRPAVAIRRLSATYHRGPVTLEIF